MRYNVAMNREKKYPTSIRLSDNAKKLIEKLSQKLGVPQSSVLELAVRALAKQENVETGD